MRICSLLPSATEIICALGLIDELVAVSHECDYPPEVRAKPVITASRVDAAALSGAEIDARVAAQLHDHTGIYELNEGLLAALKPDLILTQELCDVCAVSYEQVQKAVRALHGPRTVLSLEPESIDGILSTIAEVGHATGREQAAVELIAGIRAELRSFRQRQRSRTARVACLEWLDPPFSAGHWVPEMVGLAGGEDLLAKKGERSRRLTWDEVVAADPEIVVLMPCGYDVERTLAELERTPLPAGMADLPAIRAGRAFAVDANAYFSRPGPRVAEGVRILSEALDACERGGERGQGWRRVSRATA